jgi:hypothetical protein
MPKTCTINKNHLLDLFFHEAGGREEGKLRKHVEQCSDCRAYLFTLTQTAQALHQWQNASPDPNTLDLILEKIPAAPLKPVATKPAFPVTPFLKIALTIWAVLGVVTFLQDIVTRFPLWEMLQEWWFVKLFGSLGVALVLFFLVGAFITLALSPVLILDSQSRKYRYYFS